MFEKVKNITTTGHFRAVLLVMSVSRANLIILKHRFYNKTVR